MFEKGLGAFNLRKAEVSSVRDQANWCDFVSRHYVSEASVTLAVL